jgi:integrase
MSFERLRSKHMELIEFMKTVGYSKNYIRSITRTIEIVLSNSEKWKSYEDALNYFKQTAESDDDFTKKRVWLNKVASFDVYGTLPTNRKGKQYFRHLSSYDYLAAEFKSLVDRYREIADRRYKKPTTIQNECWNVSSFLLALQNTGCHSLSEITEDAVLSVLTNESGYPIKSATYAGQITAVFKKLAEESGDCQRVLLFIPSIRKHRKNIQYLTVDERSKVKSILRDSENNLNLRDRAIGYLLYFTGLRCSDIANLKLSDVDLDKDKIMITQQKTSSPLNFSLSAIVGNALIDYVNQERRKSESPYVFLSEVPPFGKLKAGSIGAITNKFYECAEIRQVPGDRRGGHLFRHNFATTMLENNVPRVVISRSMGQDSPLSVEPYLSADMVHLKECALSIEAFPVRKEAFCRE